MALTPTGIGVTTTTQDLVLNGDLVIRDANNVERIRLDRESGGIFLRDKNGELVFHLEFPGQNLRFGGRGQDADLVLFGRNATSLTDDANATLHLDTDRGLLLLGGGGKGGQAILRDQDGEQRIFLNADNAQAAVGANGKAGDLIVQDQDSRARIRLRAQNARADIGGAGADGELRLLMADNKTTVRIRAQGGDPGPVATLEVGGGGASGSIRILNADGKAIGQMTPSGVLTLGVEGQAPDGGIILNAQGFIGMRLKGAGEISAGAASTGGSILLHRATDLSGNLAGAAAIAIHADSGTARLGGSGGDIHGELDIRDRFDNQTVHINGQNATMTVGTGNLGGKILLKNEADETSITIDGASGDITLANGDLAEEFDLAAGETSLPGALMVLDDDANLRPCSQAYDPRVAGIAAGAGAARPAILLGRKGGEPGRIALALAGKVYCRVDADLAPVAVGDLLTTSPTSGHAMRASAPDVAHGTIIGKALAPLKAGRSLIPVLVTMR